MPSLLSKKDWEFVSKIDCNKCSDKSMCDQVKYDCPKINFRDGIIMDAQIEQSLEREMLR